MWALTAEVTFLSFQLYKNFEIFKIQRKRNDTCSAVLREMESRKYPNNEKLLSGQETNS